MTPILWIRKMMLRGVYMVLTTTQEASGKARASMWVWQTSVS